MSGQLGRLALALAFAVAVGHVAWRSLLGPPAPAYFVGGKGPVLSHPDPGKTVLYLRNRLFLPKRPRHACLEVVGRDRLHVHVNGKLISEKNFDGFPVAVVVDLAPYLQAGLNVLAIHSEQVSVGCPPTVGVTGSYTLGGQVHDISAESSWRCSSTPQRGAGTWYDSTFDDSLWPLASVTSQHLLAAVTTPPRATTEPSVGCWITSPCPTARTVALRREFEVSGRPRQAWLRMTANAPYVLAVNNTIIDAPGDKLGAGQPPAPVRRIYDITTLVRHGDNSVAVLLTGASVLPHALVDLEVQDELGGCLRLGSDGSWSSQSSPPPDWASPEASADPAWQPCFAESGDLGVLPWEPMRERVAVSLPTAVTAERTAGKIGLVAVLAVLAFVCCRLAGWLLAWLRGGPPGSSVNLAFLALLPATLALAGAVLATYDPRIDSRDIYQSTWLYLALASVLLQWCLLALAARQPTCPTPILEVGRVATGVLLLALVGAGFWLRLRDIDSEILVGDEVAEYNAVLGLLERGFPSSQAHPDVPVKYWSTSELTYFFNAGSALVFDDPQWVMRFAPVCFGTLVIFLLYRAGGRMFSPAVGFLAATFYAFSPVCVAMADAGRYYAQLQFFTLLTVYWYWCALRGGGSMDHRYLWLAASSFVAMFLTWEGSALLAPGMMLAALLQRRGRLQTVLGNRTVWLAIAVVLMALLLQNAHRSLQRTQRLTYGLGLSGVTVAPIWRYPFFDPWFYVRESTWNLDTFIPLLGLALAGLLAARHAWRGPLRFLLLIHLTDCLLLSALVAMKVFRYSTHHTPLCVLLASAAFVACCRALTRFARSGPSTNRGPAAWQGYAVVIATLPVVAALVLGSGLTVRPAQMRAFRAVGFESTQLKYPAMRPLADYLRDHLEEGDVVLSTVAHEINHLVDRPGWSVAYFPQDLLRSQVELPDFSDVPVEYRSGAVLIDSRQDLETLFARHQRIWYVVRPGAYWKNDKIFAYLREHMEVVYEDYWAMLLFRGDRHWPLEAPLTHPHEATRKAVIGTPGAKEPHPGRTDTRSTEPADTSRLRD